MKEINISRAIVNKRKEMDLTQEDVAEYIGVSKASVSKWETGQSYPDVTLLPQLAAYFNISVDELMGYEPQMKKEDISKLYQKLSTDFASQPFDEVMDECRKLVKKYYSCFPFLLQVAGLLINHHMLAPKEEQKTEIMKESIELSKRIQVYSDDNVLVKKAFDMEILGLQVLGDSGKVLELLGEDLYPVSQANETLAGVYMQLGEVEKAKTATQVAMYQYLLLIVGNAAQLLYMNGADEEKTETLVKRTIAVIDAFEMDYLHPNSCAIFYIASAQAYITLSKTDDALTMLEKYCKVCVEDFFPLALRGDSFFDLIDDWLESFDLGKSAPRDEKLVKQSIIDAISKNPSFSPLTNEKRFQKILERLEQIK